MVADRPGAGPGGPPPDLVVHRLPGVARPHAVVTVQGELDLASAPALARAVHELVRDGRTDVDADLAGVPFCDVSGFTALLLARERLRSEGGDLTMRNPCWSLLWLRSSLEPGLTFAT